MAIAISLSQEKKPTTTISYFTNHAVPFTAASYLFNLHFFFICLINNIILEWLFFFFHFNYFQNQGS